jgi:hypothetical protein
MRDVAMFVFVSIDDAVGGEAGGAALWCTTTMFWMPNRFGPP